MNSWLASSSVVHFSFLAFTLLVLRSISFLSAHFSLVLSSYIPL